MSLVLAIAMCVPAITTRQAVAMQEAQAMTKETVRMVRHDTYDRMRYDCAAPAALFHAPLLRRSTVG